MTVAEDLLDLNNDIWDAYSAIEGMGGTLPQNKNTNNLVTAINSIPGGGPTPTPDPVSDYGVVRLYDYTIEYGESPMMGGGMSSYETVVMTVADQEKMDSFCEEHGIVLDWLDSNAPDIMLMGQTESQYDVQYDDWNTGVSVYESYSTAEDLYNATGIAIEFDSGGASINFQVGKVVKINPDGPTTDITLTSSSQVNSLVPDTSTGTYKVYAYNIQGTVYPAAVIKAFYFGTVSVSLPNFFLAYTENMVYLSQFPSWMTQRSLPANALFQANSLKKITFPDSGNVSYTGSGTLFGSMLSLEELYVGASAPLPSLAGYSYICGIDLQNAKENEKWDFGKKVKITGSNRAAWISAWGETTLGGGQYRFIEDGGA